MQWRQLLREDPADERAAPADLRNQLLPDFYLVQYALKHLGEGGIIINTGSVTSFRGSKHLIDYASTKGAIETFTYSLAQNLIERGIRVNGVAPDRSGPR